MTMNQPSPPPLPENNSFSAGKNSALEQGSIIPQNYKPTPSQPVPPIRCIATVKNGERAGQRCGKWSLEGADVCIVHGGRLPNVRKHAQAVRESARLRLLGLADEAMDTIDEIRRDKQVAPQVRMKAATEILDRGGITKESTDIHVEVNHNVSPTVLIEEKLKIIAERRAQKEAELRRLQGEDDIVDEGEIIVTVDEPSEPTDESDKND